VAVPVHWGRCTAFQEESATVIKERAEPDLPVLAPLWEQVDAEVPDETKMALKELVLKHFQAFSLHEGVMASRFTDIIRHEIDTGNEQPVRQPLRRQLLALLPVIDAQVEEMLHQGIIEPSRSAWASNVVMAQKKDGSMRF